MASLVLLILVSLFFIGVPIAFGIGLTSVAYMLMSDTSLLNIPQRFVAQTNRVALTAIPFFIFAGNLMNSGGITRRIFRFATAVVGWIPGGLGHANVLASMIFAGMSGSAVADCAGLGLVEMKAMTDAGYDVDFSIGVTVASSTLGPIIPPSINMIIFGSIMSAPVGHLLLGGIVPGVVCGFFMMLTVAYLYRKRKYVLVKRPTLKEVLISLKDTLLPALTPVIILSGMLFGITTPTEASLLAVFYSLFLGVVVYRELGLKQIWENLRDTIVLSGIIFLIMGLSGPLGYVFTRERVPQLIAETLVSISSHFEIAMILVIILMLIVGCFMEVAAAIILLAPILTPAMASFNVDPIHFGVVLVFGLGIGLVTPPVGMCLYAGSAISKLSVLQVAKATLPYLVTMIITLFLIAWFPSLVTFIPYLFLGKP